MKLCDFINQEHLSRRLPQLNEILAEGKSSVTFWGTRIVTVSGYEGSIPLDDLVRRVSAASRDRCEADDWTTVERVAGIEITDKIDHFYSATDTLLSQSNVLTQLFNRINEFTFDLYPPRSDPLMKLHFLGYSEPKFIQEFGGEKYAWGGYRNASGSFGPPYRIAAPEARIREKLEAS